MRILFLDAYFEPEQTSFTHLESDLLKGLVSAGHDIEIICPVPTRGISKKTANEYKTKRSETVYGGHVHIKRFLSPGEGKNPLIRALRYFWCNFCTYRLGKKANGIDAVFATSTPPTQGWISGKVAKKLRVPFIYSLQDVFPDSLVTTGLTHEGSLLWRVGRRIENATYKNCKTIIAISTAIKDNLLNKGVDEDRISVISNWIDTDVIKPVSREENGLFDEFGIDRNKFIVLYAGNLGQAQGAEILLDAAGVMSDNPKIHFVIFGGGSGFDSVKNRAQKMPNVSVYPLQPQERISEVYSMGDVAVITCKRGVGKSGMPSKTWSIMACNTPIIASFDTDSELSSILSLYNAGVCIPAEDVDSLVFQIGEHLNISKEYGDIRKSLLQHISKESCVKDYISLICKKALET